MASFRERNGSWEYRIRYKDPYTGKYAEKSKGGFKKKGDAVYAANQIDVQKYEGFIENSSSPLFISYMQDWFETNKNQYSFNTQTIKLQSINRIEKELSHLKLKQVNYRVIQRYLDSLVSKGYSQATIDHDYTVIHQTIMQAVREDYFNRNPIAGIKISKGKSPKKARFWSIEDLNHFVVAQKNRIKLLIEFNHGDRSLFFAIRDLAIVTLLAGCGAREGELCALAVEDYDSQNHVLKIHHNLVTTTKNDLASKYERVSTMKTESSFREVPIPEVSWSSLDDWLKVRKEFKMLYHQTEDDGSLFPAYQANRPIVPATIRQQFKKLCIRYDLPVINVHGLRHTYASFLQQSGVSPKRAQILLGHKRLATTMDIYTHVTKNDKIEAVQLLDNMIQSKLN